MPYTSQPGQILAQVPPSRIRVVLWPVIQLYGVGFEFVEEKKITGFRENYFLKFRKK